MWASAAAGAAAPIDGLLDFDISAQSLGTALFQYGETTGLPAVYPSELVAGRRSSAVRGRYTSEAALRRMLQGTGLVAEKVATVYGDIFRLDRPSQAVRHTSGLVRGSGRLNGYPAQLQAGVLDVLCNNPLTVPGSYQALLRIQVDASGQARRTVLIESTGNSERDTVLLAVLQRLRTPPPPADRASVSYVISLLPAAPGRRPPCRALRAASP